MAGKLIVQNLGWPEERYLKLMNGLHPFYEKVAMFLKIKRPVIVHLYENQDEDDTHRAEYDEGIINLYEMTPDWRGDFSHELAHQLLRPTRISRTLKSKLKNLQRELIESKGDGRIFVQTHTFSNIYELWATLFKWYVLGKTVHEGYLEVLNAFQPKAVSLIEKALRDENLIKAHSFNDFDLIKKFVSTPVGKDGRVNFNAVNQGESIWITKDGRHVPITRHGDRFSVDFQAARGAGYKYQKKETSLAHQTFEIDKEGHPEKEKKELTPEKQAEAEERKVEQKKIRGVRKEIREFVGKKEESVIRMASDQAKDNKELGRAIEEIESKIEKFGLSEERKNMYINLVTKEMIKNQKEGRLSDAVKISEGEDVNVDRTSSLFLTDPTDGKSNMEFISEVRGGFYDSDNEDKLKFDLGISASTKKRLENQKEKLQAKVEEEKLAIAKEMAFERQLGGVDKDRKARLEKIMKVGVEGLKVNAKDLQAANTLFAEGQNKKGGDSIYTMLGKEWEKSENVGAQLNYLSDKSAVRQLNALAGKFLDMEIDFDRMQKGIGLNKTIQILAAHLKGKLPVGEYADLKNKVTDYHMGAMERVENRALSEVEKLKNRAKKIKDGVKTGNIIPERADQMITENLIKQRNVITASHGQLSANAELIKAMKTAKRAETIQVKLSDNLAEAQSEYRRFSYAKDRKNTKMEITEEGNFLNVGPNSLSEFYIKETKVDRKEIDRLNAIKNNKEGIKTDPKGYEYTDYKIPFFKEMFKPKPAQRNDINWLMNNGGSGIVGRSVGGGKTFIGIGFHAENLKKNPSYSTIMVIPDDVVGQQAEEIKDMTDLNYVHIPSDLSDTAARSFIKKETAGGKNKGKIFVMGHGHMSKHYDLFENKGFNNLTIDEPHEIFVSNSGRMKSKGRDIANRIRTEHRIGLTATSVQNNPANLFNYLNWTNPGEVGTRGDFERAVGGVEKYDVNGQQSSGQLSFVDMDTSKANLVQDLFRDRIDKYISYDTDIVRPYDVKTPINKVKMTPTQDKAIKDNQVRLQKELPQFIEKTPQYLREASPRSWRDKRKRQFLDRAVVEQLRLMNKSDGLNNPKSKALAKDIQANKNDKHVIYVDDRKHETHILQHLKKIGYPESQIRSLIRGKKNSQ